MLVEGGTPGIDTLDPAFLSKDEMSLLLSLGRDMQKFSGITPTEATREAQHLEGRFFFYKMLSNPHRPRIVLKSYAKIFWQESALIVMEYQRGTVESEDGEQQVDQDTYVGIAFRRDSIFTIMLRHKVRLNPKVMWFDVQTPDAGDRLNRAYGTVNEMGSAHSAFRLTSQKCVVRRISDDTTFSEIDKSIDEYDMTTTGERRKIPRYVRNYLMQGDYPYRSS
jgi:hypothetical protein